MPSRKHVAAIRDLRVRSDTDQSQPNRLDRQDPHTEYTDSVNAEVQQKGKRMPILFDPAPEDLPPRTDNGRAVLLSHHPPMTLPIRCRPGLLPERRFRHWDLKHRFSDRNTNHRHPTRPPGKESAPIDPLHV